jgi:hypothetical protein
LIYRNPKTVKNNRGIKDQHLLLIVLSLTLIDILLLTAYLIVEGALTHFSAGVAFNKEKPSAIHGVSRYIKQNISTGIDFFVYYVGTRG